MSEILQNKASERLRSLNFELVTWKKNRDVIGCQGEVSRHILRAKSEEIL